MSCPGLSADSRQWRTCRWGIGVARSFSAPVDKNTTRRSARGAGEDARTEARPQTRPQRGGRGGGWGNAPDRAWNSARRGSCAHGGVAPAESLAEPLSRVLRMVLPCAGALVHVGGCLRQNYMGCHVQNAEHSHCPPCPTADTETHVAHLPHPLPRLEGTIMARTVAPEAREAGTIGAMGPAATGSPPQRTTAAKAAPQGMAEAATAAVVVRRLATRTPRACTWATCPRL